MNDNSSHKQPVPVGVNHLNTDKENQSCKQWMGKTNMFDM